MSKATNKVDQIFKRLSKQVQEAISKTALVSLADFTVKLVKKRTRLGYGVTENFGTKVRFAKLSENYKKTRKTFSGLSGQTSVSKSNLTRTGQMIDSLSYRISGGSIFIAPKGTRDDGETNLNIAQYNADGGKGRPKRIFNRVSGNEYAQIVRFYRKRFGDLIKKSKVIT